VFIGDSGDNSPLKVISQSQQLRRSACWKRSGDRLWCGTCHDPHLEPAEKAAHYREKCLSCHGAKLAENHQARTSDCASCHMPSRGTIDGAHAAFTDHQIRRHSVTEERALKPAVLVPWRPSPADYAVRNLGLAYLSVGAQQQSPELLGKAFPLIAEARQAFPKDSELTAGLGVYADLKGMYRKAAEIFELAIDMRPGDLTSYQAAAQAWAEAGDPQKAIRNLEAAIERDPADETSYVMLAEIYGKQNNARERNRVLDRYLAFRPQSIEFRLLKQSGASR
jgi:tetratricopeptide (TPR) repeat protein